MATCSCLHSYLDHGLDPNEENETSEIQDVCSITLDKAPCGVSHIYLFIHINQGCFFCFFFSITGHFLCCLQLTDAVVNVAEVLHCAARTNLTMTEANLMRLVYELTGHLNSLVRELAAAVSTMKLLFYDVKCTGCVRQKKQINDSGILSVCPPARFKCQNHFSPPAELQ